MFSNIFSKPDKNQTLALAGLLQSSALVHQLATRDRHDTGALRESAFSLIRLDTDSIEAVYGSESGVDLGLQTMINLFTNRLGPSTKDVYQYTVNVHQLSAKLAKLSKTGDVIQRGLEEVGERFLLHYGQDVIDDSADGELYEALAELYSETVSYLTPRIIVQGSQGRLQNTQTVHRVRTALFSGIRSAWLWRQLGGRKWQLLINRGDYLNIARRLSDSLYR